MYFNHHLTLLFSYLQGEGRIMLFGLDYALFQETVASAVVAENNESKEKEINDMMGVNDANDTAASTTSTSTTNSDTTKNNTANSSANGSDKTTKTSSATIATSTSDIPTLTAPLKSTPTLQQSSEQSKFFKAIQPKLKLLWTGPGE